MHGTCAGRGKLARMGSVGQSTPITGYGEFERLRLPTRGKAIYKLPGGDLEYIDVALTGLHYDTGAAPLEGRA
jgi:hypothetical protein